ncbi:MAG TPA: hypothetical protein PKV98_17345 [Burkholderiaceae bacterium]|nr:hypothetical protein [Burkholderiaceae bacterium]
MRNRYWHDRCERWGAWRIGAKGASIAPWARMRNGMPMSNDEDHVPELHIEERETQEFVALMPPDLAAFLRRIYPWQARLAAQLGLNRQTFNERINVVHRMLARMLDQRRRGEPLDAERRRPRVHVKRTKVTIGRRRVSVAVTQG